MAMITDWIREESLGIQWRTFRNPLRGIAVGTRVSNAVTNLLVWLERARERRQLLSLGDRELQDFGASRVDAAREGEKPFWRH